MQEISYTYDHINWKYEVNGEELILPNAHCDNRILHQPTSECDACSHFPEAQIQRLRLGVAFTDESTVNYHTQLAPCPAIDARGKDSLNAWGGNVPFYKEARPVQQTGCRKRK